jgi:hypothetical protein
MRPILEGIDQATDERLVVVSTVLSHIIINRLIFFTKQGLISIGPASARPNGVCFLCDVRPLPFVLRKNADRYKLIRECIVLGSEEASSYDLYPIQEISCCSY